MGEKVNKQRGRFYQLKKYLIIFFSLVTVFVAGIIIFISPLVKHLVEKYDEQYTGRQIKIDHAYVNPFTGFVYLSNLKIYELKSDSVFLSADGVSANLQMHELLSKNYIISELVLDRPIGMIIQNENKTDLNFKDLIERFTPKNKKKSKSQVHFSIQKIKVNNGTFYYRENVIPINYFIKNVEFESTGIHWDADTIAIKFSFLPGLGQGNSHGNCTINIKNLDYHLSVVTKKFDLDFIEQYMKDLSNYGSFRANVDMDIKATGNFKHARDLNAKGQLAINEFHFGKNSKEDYASFTKFKLGIIDLSPKNKKYLFDSVVLNEPFFKYERYDHLDNIQTIFGKKGSKVLEKNANSAHFNLILEIAKYVEKLAKNFFRSYYKVNRFEINKADLTFNDYSLNEEFSIGINPFFAEADSIDKNRERVKLSIKSGIKPYGSAVVELSINPKDSSDFDLQYHLKNIPLTAFNPYLITYTSFPMDKGTIDVKGNWRVRNGNINSTNHLVIIHPHISERVKHRDSKWIPIPLVMAFVRERSEVIDYEIPITGDLKNPKFHLKDVIVDLLKNTVIKPPTTPGLFSSESDESEAEEALTLKWEMRQTTLNNDKEKFIKKAAKFLKDNPEASLSVNSVEYTSKEKEHILFYEAKKKYFLLSAEKNHHFTEKDSLYIVKMPIKDSVFVKYLNKNCTNELVFTIQDKCKYFVGNELLTKQFNGLVKQREKIFRQYFIDNGTDSRLKIYRNAQKVPFNGFSYYKLKYKGTTEKP